MVPVLRVPAGEDGLAHGQLPDGDGRHLVRVVLGELRVDLLVVLAVVADQEPAHVRELRGQALKVAALVLLAAAEPAVLGESPVREQQGAGRIHVPVEEPCEGGRGVPGAGGQVDDRRVGMLHGQPVQQHRHARGGHPGPLAEHKRVPQGQERPGQGRDHDGVVDVGDDAEPGFRDQ